ARAATRPLLRLRRFITVRGRLLDCRLRLAELWIRYVDLRDRLLDLLRLAGPVVACARDGRRLFLAPPSPARTATRPLLRLRLLAVGLWHLLLRLGNLPLPPNPLHRSASRTNASRWLF